MPIYRTLNWWFAIATLLVLLPAMAGYILPARIDLALMLVMLALFGVPHGAIDHVIFLQSHQSASGQSNIIKYFFCSLFKRTVGCFMLLVGVGRCHVLDIYAHISLSFWPKSASSYQVQRAALDQSVVICKLGYFIALASMDYTLAKPGACFRLRF
jgi:hypothetical protein